MMYSNTYVSCRAVKEGPIKRRKLLKKIREDVCAGAEKSEVKAAFAEALKKLVSKGKVTVEKNDDGKDIVSKAKRKSGDKRKHEEVKKDEDAQGDEKKAKVEEPTSTGAQNAEESQKGVPCEGNPSGITRLFLGNLPWKVTAEKLNNAFYNSATHFKWITDKESGMFYGTCFIEVDTPKNAALCVAMDGEKLMGRPIKIQYSPARPDDIWPPEESTDNPNFGPKRPSAAKKNNKITVGPPETPQPEGCEKLFMGNLSYNIDDDTIVKFFKDCGEIRDIR